MSVLVIGDIGDKAEVELMLNTVEEKFGHFTGSAHVPAGVLPDYFQRTKQKYVFSFLFLFLSFCSFFLLFFPFFLFLSFLFFLFFFSSSFFFFATD
jgi:hypothetical protein